MAPFSHADIQALISAYGYWFVGAIVGIESMGIPLPGETALVAAAIYAAVTPDFSIFGVVAAAIVGSILGDNIGYSIGRRFGYPLLLRYGRKIKMTEDRIKLGQYLFMSYGGMIVFIGRFVALLRILAAFLAGVNRMPWPSFLLANATGAVIWASVFGFGGYRFGQLVFEQHDKWGPVVAAVAGVGFFSTGLLLHRYEQRLIVQARVALPGPIESYRAK